MKLSVTALLAGLAAVASAAPAPLSYFSGFNLGANAADGSCKTTAQWKQEFIKIKSWSHAPKAKFNVAKLFATSDCNALINAVPAARATGFKLWVGVWNVDDAKFGREKAALEQAIKKWPDTTTWLKGINVGSESLYRKDITAAKLAQQIYDVKGMVQKSLKSPHVPVGTADTWTSWVNGANAPVIKACDVVIMNAFPYWQGVSVGGGLGTFKKAIANTRRAIGSKKPFMIGETGWPTAEEKPFGSAKASVANLQKYWKQAACWLQTTNYPWLFFSAFDEPQKTSVVEKNFGVAKSNKALKISLKC